MTLVVADVGGTNTRIALVQSDGATALSLSHIGRYENDEFASFYEVLSRYSADHPLPALQGACFAVAGPVTSTYAQLTNRSWGFDAADIVAALPAAFAPPVAAVHLVNDLVALGYALPDLTPDQLLQVRASDGASGRNNQALVAGMGTGFNVCMVKMGRTGPTVIEAELGHASLPASVRDPLVATLGDGARQFATIEDLFSGRGLSQVYRILSGDADKKGPQILADYVPGGHDQATRAVDLFAHLLGVFARELVFQYLPFGGIHFAGGAAQGVLGSAAQQVFLQALNTPGPFGDHIARVPVRLITDDTAALTGAARFARAQG
ncbi:MAG: glucokinase [Paracoccaceae bacterium]|jgi:glucokinase